MLPNLFRSYLFLVIWTCDNFDVGHSPLEMNIFNNKKLSRINILRSLVQTISIRFVEKVVCGFCLDLSYLMDGREELCQFTFEFPPKDFIKYVNLQYSRTDFLQAVSEDS